MEIERKYLVSALPKNLDAYPHKELVQGYLSTAPVVRVRREGDEYYLTYKSKGLVAREEANLPLNAESFDHLLKKADGIIIQKTRYFIPLDEAHAGLDHSIHDGCLAELDVFRDALAPLVVVEVEFDSVEQADAFVPPAWFGEDVSDSGLYQNSRLAERGLPEEFSH